MIPINGRPKSPNDFNARLCLEPFYQVPLKLRVHFWMSHRMGKASWAQDPDVLWGAFRAGNCVIRPIEDPDPATTWISGGTNRRGAGLSAGC